MSKTRKLQPVTKKLRRKKQAPGKQITLGLWGILAICAGLALFISFPYIFNGRFATKGTTVPAGYDKFCLDVSHHNKGIAWDSLRVAIDAKGHTTRNLIHATRIVPLKYVIVKATEGETMTDECFELYWSEAGRINVTRGAYHFFLTSKDPKIQAEHYINTVKLRSTDLPPVLDVESMHRGCSRKMLNDRVLTWLETVEKHYKRKPIVYTSDSFATVHLSRDITDNYPLWIARYNSEQPFTRNWKMWQFTDKALVIGTTGFVDLSVIK